MSRQSIHSERAPQAIGPYSQAVRAGDTVYLSGQVPFDPATMQLVSGDFEVQARRAFSVDALAAHRCRSCGSEVSMPGQPPSSPASSPSPSGSLRVT